jgi:aspartate beta-hydroxylase
VRLYDHARDVVRSVYDARIDTPAVLDTDRFFPNAQKFVARWRDIRDEALAIKQNLASVPRFHDIMREQADISANDGRDWRMFVMRAYGRDVPANRSRCPAVSALLDDSPEVVSAVFSFLAPRKHVPKHRGPFRGILRFHLMLTMPRGPDGGVAAILEIDGEPYRLEDGECLLWDDTYPHEVRNNSDEVRAALLLDVWRPEMPYDMELLSRAISGAVQLGMRFRGVSYSG